MNTKYFLSNFSEWTKKNIKKSMLLEPSYFYWCNNLLEYAIRLFTWEGLPESIPQHELEFAVLNRGYGVVVLSNKGEWLAPFDYSCEGITNYYDMFTHVNFTTPLTFGRREFGKNSVLVPNNSLKMPLSFKIQRYATMLAHIDVSIINELVNDRNSALIEAINGSQAEQGNIYLNRLYNGDVSTVINKGFEMLKFSDINRRTQSEVEKLIVVRNKTLQAYLEEIGIKKQTEKKERMITDESISNNEMLKLNISDMLECRQKSAEEMSELMKRKISVKSNIDYLSEGKEVDINE